MIDLLSDQENLSMIGKLKKKSKLEMINLLMIGMRSILTTVGKEAIVVIVTIQMININMDQHLWISNKIKGMINPTINKIKTPNLTKTNKC